MTRSPARCPHCGCERLACPWGEELQAGWPLICGQCGSLSTVDYVLDDDGRPVGVEVRHPTIDESRRFYADDQVKAWQLEYAKARLEGAGKDRSGRTPPKKVIQIWRD